jgi:type IV secretory pathway VirB10-like protein
LNGILRLTKQTRTVSQAGAVIIALATADKFKDTNGKYIRDGVEVKSSEESMDEALQKKLWELSGRYTRLEGFEPLDAPTPPPEPVKEEPNAVEPAKTEEAAANGDAAKAAPDANDKTADESKNDEDKKKDAPKEGENAEKKDEEKKEEKTEEPAEKKD